MALDLERFWTENRDSSGKAFSTDKPRAPISLSVDDHWLLDELKVPSTVRFYRDLEYRAECHRLANDRCEKEIGIRLFAESLPTHSPKRIEEVFGARIEVIEGGTPWIEPGVSSPAEFAAILDHLESLDDEGLRALAEIPAAKPISGDTSVWSRGPATVATSVLGTTEAMIALIEEPDLMNRFYKLMADILVRYQRLLATSWGKSVHGVGILDDNCALVSPALYRRFCWPVWRHVANELASDPGAMRYQHSDSAMEHLLPLLAELDLTACNFGPTLLASTIRSAMPQTEIHGQLAPFTLRDGTAEAIEAEVRRDWEAVGADGGLLVTTAGSIPAGTSLAAIRTFMEIVDRVCRYDA